MAYKIEEIEGIGEVFAKSSNPPEYIRSKTFWQNVPLNRAERK